MKAIEFLIMPDEVVIDKINLIQGIKVLKDKDVPEL